MKSTKDTSKHSKKKYRVKNWKKYNTSLIERGSLTLWIPDDVEHIWYTEGKGIYTDSAIEIMLTLKALYKLPLRGLQGLVVSIFGLLHLPLDVPNYSTVSRRAKKPGVSLKKQAKGHINLILDSTGGKVFGEGEWKVRKHGWSKRRTWTKIHIGTDSDGEIRVAVTTENNVHDSTVIDDALAQEESTIDGFWGDGAYDAAPVYMSLVGREVSHIHIPPRKGAKVRIHGNTNALPYVRDENIRAIRKSSRAEWKQSTGYHTRSHIENTMFRYKTNFGERFSFRNKDSQHTEVMVKCNILNTFLALGMPESYIVSVP